MIRKTLKRLLIFLTVFAGVSCAAEQTAAQPQTAISPQTQEQSPDYTMRRGWIKPRTEFRGIWVATVENIDFGKHTTEEEFKHDFCVMLDKIDKAGFNTVIFQIRPMNDAFYPSKYNPWSRWMTGTEGKTLTPPANAKRPDCIIFDPLAFMISECHKRGMDFEAWLNPYRVANNVKGGKTAYLKTLDKHNFAALHPELVLEFPGSSKGRTSLILNPGEPQVQMFLLQTIREIATRYHVDGIHFDDYFYPYTDIGNADAETYRQHALPKESLEDWRRRNVDTMVKNIHDLLKSVNKEKTVDYQIRFGISPFGIWANNSGKKFRPEGSATKGSQSYFVQYADTRKWVRKGWLDYIAPQLYWKFDTQAAPYGTLVQWWADTVRGTNVKLYIGQGIYRIGNAGWKESEMLDQLKFNSQIPEVSGHIFFSYIRMVDTQNAAQKRAAAGIKNYWQSIDKTKH